MIDGHWTDSSGADDMPSATEGSYQRRVQNGYGEDAPLFEEVFSERVDNDSGASPAASEGLLWALADHAGSVRDVLGEDAQLVEHREFDAHGVIEAVVDANKAAVATAELAIDAAFAGREWDDDAELYYNRARWYDAGQGRFISEDPIGFAGGDTNVYRYAGGDPINLRDPSGLFFNK